MNSYQVFEFIAGMIVIVGVVSIGVEVARMFIH